MSHWVNVCALDKIFPGTGVCALVDQKQVAIFRPHASDDVYAIANMDPFARSNVLSRGIICEHEGQYWVASPLKKQRFNLVSGHCLENDEVSVDVYKARVVKGHVEISVS
ncbi:nitrite reductase small subunit [Psychromonas sp. CNPT3]|uniref:nitrite reductase small subunit NirD n=1 Tax=Psychromonas sp. CNPT3 TaxID=314282 RepID=UPI00006E7075|nr:nitrite reductase small subunit NirD [Psychromonas sp. CNPT3]AGH80091.1 nitrite reductase small subunit [Psychromonas sp. CNPT3]